MDGRCGELRDARGLHAERLTDEALGEEDGELDDAIDVTLRLPCLLVTEREEARSEPGDLLLACLRRGGGCSRCDDGLGILLGGRDDPRRLCACFDDLAGDAPGAGGRSCGHGSRDRRGGRERPCATDTRGIELTRVWIDHLRLPGFGGEGVLDHARALERHRSVPSSRARAMSWTAFARPVARVVR